MGGGRGESGRRDLPICKCKKVLNSGVPVKPLFSSMFIWDYFWRRIFELRRRVFYDVYIYILSYGDVYIYIYIYISFWMSAWCVWVFRIARVFGFWMSTVLGFGKISCDSARWWNFIFPSPKKKLRAASSWTPLAFLLRASSASPCACIWVCGDWVNCGFFTNNGWFLFLVLFLKVKPLTCSYFKMSPCFQWTLLAMFSYPECPSAQGWHTPCSEKCNQVIWVVTQNRFFVCPFFAFK